MMARHHVTTQKRATVGVCATAAPRAELAARAARKAEIAYLREQRCRSPWWEAALPWRQRAMTRRMQASHAQEISAPVCCWWVTSCVLLGGKCKSCALLARSAAREHRADHLPPPTLARRRRRVATARRAVQRRRHVTGDATAAGAGAAAARAANIVVFGNGGHRVSRRPRLPQGRGVAPARLLPRRASLALVPRNRSARLLRQRGRDRRRHQRQRQRWRARGA